jgi:dihydroxyacetone kinase-like predicted kinase
VQFLIEQPKKPVAKIAADITKMGDCPLVEGDEKLVKVHVHVFDPGVPLSYGVATGFITDVVVENMDDMAAGGPLSEAQVQAAAELTEDQIGLVAVVPGHGFGEIFRNLGANAVVEGGQSMNPSVAELARAVRTVPIRRVVLLPNNSNILMAAQQTAKLVAKDEDPRQVIVVPARSMPQGIAALTAFDPAAADMNDLLAGMTQAMGTVQAGEVTQAVRTAEVDGIHVHQGDLIGLHNDKLVSCGGGLQEVAFDLLTKMGAAKADLISIYFGDFVAAAAAQDFAETVRSEYPSSDVELAYGGQPHYHYILSTE